LAEEEVCFRNVKHLGSWVLLGGAKGDLILSNKDLTFRSESGEVRIELKRIVKVEKGGFLGLQYIIGLFSIYLDDGRVERFIAKERDGVVRAISKYRQNIAEEKLAKASQVNRPKGITILAALSLLGGVISFLPLLELLKLWHLTVGSGIFFANGIPGFIFTLLLLAGKGYLVIVGFQVAGIILSIANGAIIGDWRIIVYSPIIGLLILHYLTKPHVKLFFGRGRQTLSKPIKQCPNCSLKIDLEAKTCPVCGFEQPPTAVKEGNSGGRISKLLVIGAATMLIMLIIVFSGLPTILMNITHSGRAEYSLPVNVVAPSFTLADINGEPLTLKDFRGKIVILDFFATWCGPCKTQMLHLSQVYREYGFSKVVIISISIDPVSDTIEKLKQYASENSIEWIIVRDTAKVAGKYGVSAIPTIFIIDQEGIIRYTHVGVTSSSMLLSEIETLIR